VYGTGYRTFEFRNGGVFGKGFIFTGNMGRGAFRPGAKQGIGSRILGKLAGYALKKMTGIGADGGGDRYDSLRLTPEQAKNGGKVPYTDKGSSRNILITVPPGVSHGQMIRLKGMGSQGGPFTSPGDLYLEVEIIRPFLQRVKSFLKDRTDGLRPAG